ncbi:hypothetical protein AAG906_012445 [Vitis piasezkii]
MEYRGHSSNPDPLDTSVLVLQDRHRSHLVDSGQVCLCGVEMDSRLRPYIIRSGFYGVYRIGHITLDWGLITSLVERWRPRHTHFTYLGSAISTRWLCHRLSPPVDLDDATLERYARAFILGLIDSTWVTRFWSTTPSSKDLEHDAADDLPVSGFMGALHGRLSCPSSGDISSRPGDLADDVTSYLL